jgi:hypothetical protein
MSSTKWTNLRIIAPLDVLDLLEEVRDGALADVLAVARVVDLLLPRVVEAERAGHRAAALADEHLAVRLAVDRRRLVHDVAVGEAEGVDVLDQRALGVLVDLAGLAVLDRRSSRRTRSARPRCMRRGVDDRGPSPSPRQIASMPSFSTYSGESVGCGPARDREDVRQELLHLLVDLGEVEVHPPS